MRARIESCLRASFNESNTDSSATRLSERQTIKETCITFPTKSYTQTEVSEQYLLFGPPTLPIIRHKQHIQQPRHTYTDMLNPYNFEDLINTLVKGNENIKLIQNCI